MVIGEWGSVDKGNTSARAAHAGYYVRAARERGMLPVWWDNGDSKQGGFALLNRSEGAWYFPEIVDALANSARTRVGINVNIFLIRFQISHELTLISHYFIQKAFLRETCRIMNVVL